MDSRQAWHLLFPESFYFVFEAKMLRFVVKDFSSLFENNKK